MSVSIAAEWSELNNRFYRKQELYSMSWGTIDLSRHLVACARFAGPIATVRDEDKLLILGAESTRPRVCIYSSSGLPITSFVWDKERIIKIGWTEDEVLLVVVDDGTVFQFSIHGVPLPTQFSFGEEAGDGQGICDCQIWGSGMVVMSDTYRLFAVTSLQEPRPFALANPGLQEMPHCMEVIPPEFTVSGSLEVLLAVGSTVLAVTANSVQDRGIQSGPITMMALSPNGNFLACFTHEGKLLVLSADFTKVLSDIETESTLPPQQLVWCGLDSVLLYWEEMLMMVGPYGDAVKYYYDGPVVLIAECDGVRILSNSTMEFLQRVPDCTVSIFGIGSTSPGAMLYEAWEHFDKRSAKADENIRSIGSSLPEAVETCIEAAGHEFDVSVQRSLLRAAAYGRAFCRSFPKERFREMCKTLRVLNAVRVYQTGIPLSFQQLQELTCPVLVARLINRHQHLLALRISQYLGLDQDPVLVHWACAKIAAMSGAPDKTVLELLVEKLKRSPSVSYAAIAKKAHKNGRPRLAAMLLDYEPCAAEQVPLLTSMGEDERALVKAIESGDTDLIYFVLFHLQREKPIDEFFKFIQGKPIARDLFVAYARQNEPEMLKNFYFTAGAPQGAADVLMREFWAMGKDRSTGGGSALQGPRIRMLDQAQDLYNHNKETAFQAKVAEEAAKLLKIQQELEASTGQPIFVDSSVSDTIRTCLIMGNNKAATRIRNEFKVPEKRFYWLKIFALANAKDWEGLEKFSKEKKPPVGYKAFVDACVVEGENAEAAKYIQKIPDLNERAEAYAQIGMMAEAAEAAEQSKDSELLSRLRSTLTANSAAGALFDSIRDRLVPGS